MRKFPWTRSSLHLRHLSCIFKPYVWSLQDEKNIALRCIRLSATLVFPATKFQDSCLAKIAWNELWRNLQQFGFFLFQKTTKKYRDCWFILQNNRATFSEICSCFTKLCAGNPTKFGSVQLNMKAHSIYFKNELCNSPVLAFFVGSLDSAIHIDASSIACGAFLISKHPPVCFCLRKFSSNERDLSTTTR